MIKKRLNRFKEKEKGSMLIGILILIVILSVVSTTILTLTLSSTQITTNTFEANYSQNNSNSGLETALAKLNNGACQAVSPIVQTSSEAASGIYYRADFTWDEGKDCKNSPTLTIDVVGYDSAKKLVEYKQISTYSYIPGIQVVEGAAITSAVYSANAGVNASNLILDVGDIIIRKGNFTCSGTSLITGTVVVLDPTASVAISNGCKISGSLYTNGVISNFTGSGTSVGGNVFSLSAGRFTMSSSANVAGSVYTNGTLNLSSGAKVAGSIYSTKVYNGNDFNGAGTVISGSDVSGSVYLASTFGLNNSAKIGGSLTTSSTGRADIYQSTVTGSLRIGGSFAQLGLSTISGNLTSSANQINSISPNTSVGGSIVVAGTISSWSGGPIAAGGILINTANVSPIAPTFEIPKQLDGTISRNLWVDYDFVPSVWTAAGWTIITATSAQCDYQNNATLRNKLNGYTEKTVIDARACASLNLYGINIKLKTSVTFLMTPTGSGSANFQQMRWSSFDGKAHELDIIVPDTTLNNAATCPSNSKLNFYGTNIAYPVAGFAYTPCTISFGSGSGIIWRGQLYYGGSADSINGGSPHIDFFQVQIPGLYMVNGSDGAANDENSSGSGVGVSGTLGGVQSKRQG